MKTVSELIYEYLKKNRGWRFGGTMEREVTQLHKPATVSRELRKLASEDLIYQDKRLIDSRWCRVYKYKKI